MSAVHFRQIFESFSSQYYLRTFLAICARRMVLTDSPVMNRAYSTTMPFQPPPSSSSSSLDITQSIGGHDGPSDILRLMWRTNNFLMQGLKSQDGSSCLPLIVGCQQIGVLKRQVVEILSRYPEVFLVNADAVVLNPQLSTYQSRTAAMANVLMDIRLKRETIALRSWRNENFVVWGHYGKEALMEVERSAVALLGIRAYGIHITGYVRGEEGQVSGVWLQKRADDKPTYPGMLDNMVGGGITAGLTASQVLAKEAAEEASIPSHMISRAISAGTVSFFTETERGIHANTEHIYDLELPSGFVPQNSDGEVQDFKFVPVKDIFKYLLDPNYKLTSTPILASFLIRHGIINSDTVPDFPEVVEMLHISLNLYYRMWPTFSLNQNKYPSAMKSMGDVSIPAMSAMAISSSEAKMARLNSVLDSDVSSIITESSQSERNYDSDVRVESEDDIYY